MNTVTALEYLKEVRLQVEAAIDLIKLGGLREDPRATAGPYDVIIGDFGVKAIRGEFSRITIDDYCGQPRGSFKEWLKSGEGKRLP
jgi:hypothetical protein